MRRAKKVKIFIEQTPLPYEKIFNLEQESIENFNEIILKAFLEYLKFGRIWVSINNGKPKLLFPEAVNQKYYRWENNYDII